MLSNVLGNALLDHVLRGITYTPGTPHFGLLLDYALRQVSSPTSEVTGAGYARQPITFAAAADQRSLNDTVIEFPTVTAQWASPSQPVVSGAIFFQAVSGSWLATGEFKCPRIIPAGATPPRFPIRSIRVRFPDSGRLLISDYLANKLLDHFLGVATYTPPGAVYTALCKNPPVRETASLGAIEVSGGGYGRVETTFAAAVDQKTANSDPIEFGEPTADWATPTAPVVATAICDAASAGNWLFASEIRPKAIQLGDRALVLPVASVRAFFSGGGMI